MAVGTITKEVIDSLVIEAGATGLYPDAIHVYGDVYACVYEGESNHGYLKTFSVDVVGNMGAAVLATLEFDTGQGGDPSISKLSSGVFAITYTTTGSNNGDGRIYTLSISDDGATLTPIDAWTFTSQGGGYAISMLHHTGTIYVIAYSHNVTPQPRLSTVSIATNGIITKSFLDTLDVGGGVRPRTLIKHAANIVIYASGATVYTILINDSGTSISTINSLSISGSGASNLHLLKLNDSIDPAYYATFYRETTGSFDGNITTLPISAAGLLTSTIETRKVSNDMLTNYPLNLSGSVRAWCETGPSNDGYVSTRSISNEGVIESSNVDAWEFDETAGQYFKMLHISGNVFMIVYQPATGIKALTLEINNAFSIFPTDPTVRVSSIIHRYDRFKGTFQLEMSLGDTTSKFGLPYEIDARRGTGAEQQADEAAPIVDEAVEAVKSKDAMARLLEVAKTQAAERAALLQNILFPASDKITAPQPLPPKINPMEPMSVEQEARMTTGWKRLEAARERQIALLKLQNKET